MAYLLFIDESGQDHRESPYEVLAGVAIHDTNLWQLVRDVQALEVDHFGARISEDRRELKARKLLRRKTFRLARQMPPIPRRERAPLARQAILSGETATRVQLTALSQAKVDFAGQVFRLCSAQNIRFFTSVVSPDAPKPDGNLLRKDYAYLFERFFYFLDEQPQHERGLVVFDELERSRAHILVTQMSEYFRRTAPGQDRVRRIVPEPLFVHSDLTTGVQLADLVAYVIAWNVRFQRMRKPRREELNDLGRAVLQMRHRAVISYERRDDFQVWSFAYINDLRPRGEQEEALLERLPEQA